MIRRSSPLILVFALIFSPGSAQAQRYRSGPVITPYGPLYNTNSPEYKMSGGNPLIMEELQEQKLMQQQMQQMQQMMKQQMAYQKQMQDYLKKHPEVKKQYEDQQKKMLEAYQTRAKSKRKKRSTTTASAKAATPAASSGVKAEQTGTPKGDVKTNPSAKPSLAESRTK